MYGNNTPSAAMRVGTDRIPANFFNFIWRSPNGFCWHFFIPRLSGTAKAKRLCLKCMRVERLAHCAFPPGIAVQLR